MTINPSPAPPAYDRLFDAVLSPLLVLAPDFTIVAVNHAYLAATSTKAPEIMGRSIFDVFPDNPDDPTADGVANLRRSLETVVATGRTDTMSLQRYDIPSADGGPFTERYWSPVNAPVLDDKGEVAHIVHRVEDVTDFVHQRRAGREQERARAEAQMRAERMEIDLFVRAREIREVNDQLRQANTELGVVTEQLRHQQEAKDRFIATLSHELRNPLAAASAAAELLGLDLSAGHPALSVLDRQLGVLARMSDDLLDAARALTGRLELVRETLDLRTVVRMAIDDVEHTFTRTQRTVEVKLPELPVYVDGDGVRLAQLLVNLLTNAHKYTGPGRSTFVAVERAGERARLTVRDQGIGFEPARAEELFGAFTRVAQAGPTTPEGLGLGLSVVRTIAHLHGGSVTAHSDGPGTGATFTALLPLASAAPAPPTPEPRAEAIRPPQGLRVLLVEDNSELAAAYDALLRRRGHRVTTVHTGRDALASAGDSSFDLVLCDLGLPDIDGIQVARSLRAAPRSCPARLVAVSGLNRPSDQAKSYEAGFDAHLGKPLALADLDALLAAWERGR